MEYELFPHPFYYVELLLTISQIFSQKYLLLQINFLIAWSTYLVPLYSR